MTTGKSLLAAGTIKGRILLLRQQKVILSADLALLYDVEARILVQAVKRNLKRLPNIHLSVRA